MNRIKEDYGIFRRTKNENGFTLIELVIVVAVIGILTAIAIPSYGAIQKMAKQASVDGTMNHRLTEIAAVYAQDGETAARTAANTRTPTEANIFVLPTTGGGSAGASGICQLVVFLDNPKDTNEWGSNPEFLEKIQYIYSGQSLDSAPFAWAGGKVIFGGGDPEFMKLNSSNYISSCPLV